ncbi:MAG: hypothetical protein DRO00_09145 [Thermoproteota archaeon]|nr:MAG: hypothetical protein DRO00_09145 [Candidatus Korarchaeota archaeon]
MVEVNYSQDKLECRQMAMLRDYCCLSTFIYPVANQGITQRAWLKNVFNGELHIIMGILVRVFQSESLE